ncbi:MAG: SLBB domain-containing protein [Myxococcales bacterium]|nr:SLBB domain-containing protein [Myxococcales bacterium]
MRFPLLRSRMGHAWPSLALSLALVGCGGLPVAPAYPGDDPSYHAAEAQEMPGIAADSPAPLALEPGDVVTLRRISTETTEDTGLVVDEKGNLHLPLAGDVKVAGLNLTAAEQAVEEAIRKFDRVARVALVLEAPNGQQATVVGAVVTPGRIPVTPGMRVADLLAAAGGPVTSSDYAEHISLANLGAARLIREGRTMPISLPRALEGDPHHNVLVRPRDQLHVPATTGARVSVLGELRDAKPVAWRPGLRLTEALSINQDITIDGDRSDIRILRGPSKNPKVYQVDLLEIVDGEASDPVLAPGDVVYVTDHWIASVGEVLDRLGPILSIGIAVGTVAITLSLTNNN